MAKRLIAAAVVMAISAACGKKGSADRVLPAGFDSMGDEARVSWMAEHVPADSLARFVVLGALGKSSAGRIDSLGLATVRAYEILRDKDAETFAIEFDRVKDSLPLADKMRLYVLAGEENPQGLGYRLGLEYVASVRDGRLDAEAVEKELNEFRRACAGDSATYRRFMTGFRTVLRLDSGIDLPREVYERFAGED